MHHTVRKSLATVEEDAGAAAERARRARGPSSPLHTVSGRRGEAPAPLFLAATGRDDRIERTIGTWFRILDRISVVEALSPARHPAMPVPQATAHQGRDRKPSQTWATKMLTL